MVTTVPTVPIVGVTLTTCGETWNILTAELIPLAVMVVVPNRWTSTVQLVVNEPCWLATVVARLTLVPNATLILSPAAYPVPLIVTIVPTVPIEG